MEKGGQAPTILNIGTVWSWVASYTCRRFTPGKEPGYPLMGPRACMNLRRREKAFFIYHWLHLVI